MIYMALISAGLAVRREAHVRMTALDKYLPQMLVKTLDVFDDLMVLGFSALMFAGGHTVCSTGRGAEHVYQYSLAFPVLAVYSGGNCRPGNLFVSAGSDL